MKKILTINGGGSLGLIPAILLSKIEEETKTPCYQLFDLISGVSTGAIIAAGLASGMPAKDVVSSYKELIPSIFGKPKFILSRLYSSKYDNKNLENALKHHLDIPLNAMKTKFMCHAVKISGNTVEPIFWKSWRNDETPVYKVVKASCSAPTFFDPTEINGSYYVDGAMATNNVSMCALAEHIREGGTLSDVFIINMSCFISYGMKNPGKIRGLIDWAPRIASTFMSASDPLAEYQCHQLIGFRNHTVDPNFLHQPIDTTDIDAMVMAAEDTWRRHRKSLMEKIES